MSIRRCITAALLMGATGIAFAQQAPAPAAPAAQQLTAEQKAQILTQNRQMIAAAMQVAQMIDQGKAGDVWDGFSPVAKPVISRADFVRTVNAERARTGAVVSRTPEAITRTTGSGQTPPGYYINISFATRFVRLKAPVHELISFHLDQDKRWRVTGYNLR